MKEREFPNKTIEVITSRAETDSTSFARYDDIDKIPLSSEILFLGPGHVANVLACGTYYLNDFALVKGRKAPDDTVEKVNALLMKKLNLKEDEVYIIDDTSTKRSPVIIGQIPWENLLERETFSTDRFAMFYLLDSLEQELGQADIDVELTWLDYRHDHEKYLTRIKRILTNAMSTEEFLKSARTAQLPFDEIGLSEYKKTFDEILALNIPTEMDAALDRLIQREKIEKALKKYKKPIIGINKHLRRLLGLKKGKKRAVHHFIKKIEKPVDTWQEQDFIEYLEFIQKKSPSR